MDESSNARKVFRRRMEPPQCVGTWAESAAYNKGRLITTTRSDKTLASVLPVDRPCVSDLAGP
jgi:hypothetical protein